MNVTSYIVGYGNVWVQYSITTVYSSGCLSYSTKYANGTGNLLVFIYTAHMPTMYRYSTYDGMLYTYWCMYEL